MTSHSVTIYTMEQHTVFSVCFHNFSIRCKRRELGPELLGTSLSTKDAAGAIQPGAVIADVDDTALDSMTMTTNSGTFTLASTMVLHSLLGDGTADNQMVFGGSIANINTAIATM